LYVLAEDGRRDAHDAREMAVQVALVREPRVDGGGSGRESFPEELSRSRHTELRLEGVRR
jgi:hypothetical protein